jgi:hypothetical protein
MKKIFVLTMALLAATFSAEAWTTNLDKGAIMFALEHLNPQTKNLVKEYVGEGVINSGKYLETNRKNDRMLNTEGWQTLHIDKNMQPSAKGKNDALVQIEKALKVIRNHEKQSKSAVGEAIQIVINLMFDMHNLSNVALEEYPLSGTDFEFMMTKGSARGKGGKLIPYRWKVLWTSRYPSFHAGYSPEMWVEELNVMFGGKKEEYSAGTLRDWAVDIGNYSKPIYERLQQDNNHFLHATIHSYDLFSMSCVAKATYRLAALLNENLK